MRLNFKIVFMKKLLFSVATLLILNIAFAQEPVFNWNTSNTKPNLDIETKTYLNFADGYYLVNKIAPSATEFNPTISVECFNNKNERVYKKIVNFEAMEDFAGAVYLNKTIYIFKSLFSKDAGKNTLTATPLNAEGMNLGKPVTISSISAEKLVQRGRFNVASSTDGSKLIVLSQPNFVKDENEKITIALYNDKLEKQWSSDQTFTYPWTRAVDNEPFVNNNGTAFILKKTDMKGDDNTYSIFSFTGKALKEFKIQMDGKKKIATIAKAFADNGDFTIGGYYTEDSKVKIGFGTAFHGSFLQRIDNGGETVKIAVINPFEKRKDIVAKSIVFNNNNPILLGEEYFVTSQSRPKDPKIPLADQDMFARDYSYNGLDIIIDGFDAAGKPLYFTSINKSNSSKNDNGVWVSYFGAIMKGKLYIIFNDEKSNYDEKKKAIIFGGSPKIIVYTTVDPVTGVAAAVLPVSNTGPVGGKSGDMNLHPDVFIKLNDNQCVIRAESADLYRMGLVNF